MYAVCACIAGLCFGDNEGFFHRNQDHLCQFLSAEEISLVSFSSAGTVEYVFWKRSERREEAAVNGSLPTGSHSSSRANEGKKPFSDRVIIHHHDPMTVSPRALVGFVRPTQFMHPLQSSSHTHPSSEPSQSASSASTNTVVSIYVGSSRSKSCSSRLLFTIILHHLLLPTNKPFIKSIFF